MPHWSWSRRVGKVEYHLLNPFVHTGLITVVFISKFSVSSVNSEIQSKVGARSLSVLSLEPFHNSLFKLHLPCRFESPSSAWLADSSVTAHPRARTSVSLPLRAFRAPGTVSGRVYGRKRHRRFSAWGLSAEAVPRLTPGARNVPLSECAMVFCE